MVVNSDNARKIINYAESKNCIIKETQTGQYTGIWVNEKRRIAKIYNNYMHVNDGILKYVDVPFLERNKRSSNGKSVILNIKVEYQNIQTEQQEQIIDASIEELASKYYFQGN